VYREKFGRENAFFSDNMNCDNKFKFGQIVIFKISAQIVLIPRYLCALCYYGEDIIRRINANDVTAHSVGLVCSFSVDTNPITKLSSFPQDRTSPTF